VQRWCPLQGVGVCPRSRSHRLQNSGLTDAFILSLTESKEITLVKFGEDDNLGSKCFL